MPFLLLPLFFELIPVAILGAAAAATAGATVAKPSAWIEAANANTQQEETNG